MNLTLIGLLLTAGLLLSCGKKAKDKNLEALAPIGPTPEGLMVSAQQKLDEVLKKADKEGLHSLLQRYPQLNLNSYTLSGETPLTYVIKEGQLSLLALLLDHGADVNKANLSQDTPLTVAIKNTNTACLNLLLQQKIDLDKKNGHGLTPLHLALRLGREEMALSLIRSGAQISLKDPLGFNAIELALKFHRLKVYDYLLNLRFKEFGAPDLARFKQILQLGNPKILTKILNQYPNTVKDFESLNPLALAIDTASDQTAIEMLDILLAYKAPINGPLSNIPPLVKAVKQKRIKLVKWFLKHQADLHALDPSRLSALAHAVLINHFPIVQELLNAGANRKDKRLSVNLCKEAKNLAVNLTSKALEDNKNIRKALGCPLSFFL